ncbi:hypothetical protein HOY80DRAFT_1042374 [Tuber brumale]|nr:hypothetical protein HOY80DRAFT_1042374 [Tuber brumale]
MPCAPQTFTVLEIRCRPVARDTNCRKVVSDQNLGAIADPDRQLKSAVTVIHTDCEKIHSTTTQAGGEKPIKYKTVQSIEPEKCEEKTLVADFTLGRPCGGRASCEDIQEIIEALQMHIAAQDEMITFLQRLQEVSLDDCLGRVTGALHAFSLGNGHPITPGAQGNRGPGTQRELTIIDCQNVSGEDGWVIADGLFHEGASGRRDFAYSLKLGAPPLHVVQSGSN